MFCDSFWVTPTPTTNELAAMLKQARLTRAEHEEIEAALEARLKAAIGDADGIETADGRITWRRSKDSARVNWESIARALNPPEQLIKNCSELRRGSRRFVVPRDWGKDE